MCKKKGKFIVFELQMTIKFFKNKLFMSNLQHHNLYLLFDLFFKGEQSLEVVIEEKEEEIASDNVMYSVLSNLFEDGKNGEGGDSKKKSVSKNKINGSDNNMDCEDSSKKIILEELNDLSREIELLIASDEDDDDISVSAMIRERKMKVRNEKLVSKDDFDIYDSEDDSKDDIKGDTNSNNNMLVYEDKEEEEEPKEEVGELEKKIKKIRQEKEEKMKKELERNSSKNNNNKGIKNDTKPTSIQLSDSEESDKEIKNKEIKNKEIENEEKITTVQTEPVSKIAISPFNISLSSDGD
jgi:hypothetical protein